MENKIRPKIVLFLVYTAFIGLALFGSLKANDFSLLNSENSVYIANESFEPDLSVRKINRSEQGLQEYRVQISGEELKGLETETLVLFLNKLTDNAYSVKLNGTIIGSEGDMENGHSMFKNSPNHFSFDRELVEDDNELLVSTYASYKSGLEAKGVYIADGDIGMRQARNLDFFGNNFVLIVIGFLIFSILIMIFIYYLNKKREIGFLYFAIATAFMTIYFFDYIKIVYLSYDYLFYKKIFLISLYIAIWFYMLAMSHFLKCLYLKYIAAFNASSFIIMSLFVDNFILYKRLYTYWYFLLLINIILGFVCSLRNIRKVRQAFILVGAFLYASVYAGLAIIIEFLNFSFSINSPLVYLFVFSALPLLFGFEELISKEEQISYEKKEKEKEYLNSMTDNLTSTWNQRYLYRKLEERIGETILAMIDLDDFKEINDNYGHLAGDFVLKEFTDLAINTFRKTDNICRYGGDEFIILLYDCDKAEAVLVMEKLRRKVEEHDFVFDGQLMKITISIGIYETREDESVDQAIEKADKKLYLSKEKGKNIISI